MTSHCFENTVINCFDLETAHQEQRAGPEILSASAKKPTMPSGDRPTCFRSTSQECLFVLTVTFAVSLSQTLSGALICMTNFIGTDLHMTAAEVTWINTAQSLTNGAFLLLFGRVADLFGRRLLLIISMSLTTLSLVATGFVTDGVLIDASLGLIGLAAAAAVPPAIGKLGAVYKEPSKRKNRAFACCSAGTPLGSVLGAVVGGITLEVSTWRTCFWFLAVVSAIFTLTAWWTIPRDTEQVLTGFNISVLKHFDILGAFLAVAGIACLTASLTLAGQAPHGWRTPYVLVLLIAGVIVVTVFLYWESVFAYPLMPLSIWKDRNFSLLVAILCLCFFGFVGNMMWLCLIWQRIERDSGLIVAAKLLPAGLSGLCVNLVVALTMHRIDNRVLIAVGTAAFVAFNTLLSASSEHISYWALTFPALILSTIGADFQFTVTNVYVLSSMPVEQQSVGGGVLVTMSRFASTIGLGVQTSIFTAAGGAASGPGALHYRAYQTAFWVSLVGSGTALLLLPFVTLGAQGAKLETASDGTSRDSLAGEDRKSELSISRPPARKSRQISLSRRTRVSKIVVVGPTDLGLP